MKYDFILFENAYDIENHYIDLSLFASLLKKMEYNVAIANVFKESKLCRDSSIPHITLKYRCPKQFSTLSQYRKRTNSIKFHYYRILHSLYLVYVIVSLSRKGKNLYIGSLTSYTPFLWLFFLFKKNNYFIWGLRSHILYSWKKKLDSFTLTAILRTYKIKRSSNIKLVTSNDIIKNEFISLGIPSNRIIVRPERWITKQTKNITSHSIIDNQTSFLTIGTLRRSKHVEYVLDAFKVINDSCYSYTIAGRCKDDNGYEDMLNKHSEGIPNVKRINTFINDEDYVKLFQQCDFLILCDEKEISCPSNGTMVESLIWGRPIIAPNQEPFKYEIDKYGIGLLYDFNNLQSLVETLRIARTLGSNYFSSNILQYQEMLLEQNVILFVDEQIKKIIK